MPDRRCLPFTPGNEGLLFFIEPRNEPGAKKDIERMLRVLAERYSTANEKTEVKGPSPQSFLADLQSDIAALAKGRAATGCTGFKPCVSKVNGYMPYLMGQKRYEMGASSLLEAFFRDCVVNPENSIQPRHVRKVLPFSHCCKSNLESIHKTSKEMIQAAMDVSGCSSPAKASIPIAVEVSVRANTSLERMQSKLKCDFLGLCWESAEAFVYDAGLHQKADKLKTRDGKTTIVFHIVVLSKATFLGFCIDSEKLNGYSFRMKAGE